MTESRGLERMVFFTDAVVAIAITLLILPLVDRVPEAASDGGTLAAYLADNGTQLGALILSFLVIARLWLVHHGLFQHVATTSPLLLWLNLAWALTIVLLPLPTSLIAEFEATPLAVVLYIGTMFVSSLLLALMLVVIKRTPGLELESNPLGAERVPSSFVTVGAFAAALIIGSVFPSVNYWALLLLLLIGPISRLVRRRVARTR
jgi:uncharacterized membrane protein